MRCVWLIYFLLAGERVTVALRLGSSQASSRYNLPYTPELRDCGSHGSSRLVRRGVKPERQRSPPASIVSSSASGPGPPRRQYQTGSLSSDHSQAGPSRSMQSLRPDLPTPDSPGRKSPIEPPSSGDISRQGKGRRVPDPLTTGRYMVRKVVGPKVDVTSERRKLVNWIGNALSNTGRRFIPGTIIPSFAKKTYPNASPTSGSNSLRTRVQISRQNQLTLHPTDSSLRDQGTASVAPAPILDKDSVKSPGQYGLDHNVIAKHVEETKLQRSHSDPVRQRYPPIRTSRAAVNKAANSAPRKLTTPIPGSEVSSPPASVLSHTSFEIDHPGGSRGIASSARSTMATSAFASLSDGPAISGAGIRTTIDSWPSSGLLSAGDSRRTTAGSMGSYELPSHYQPSGYNGGTATGPQTLAGKGIEKMSIAGNYFKEHPGDAVRASGSSIGHTLLGAGPGAAVSGTYGLAGAIGVTGAVLTYFSGNDRIIPKIDQWQQDKGKSAKRKKGAGS